MITVVITSFNRLDLLKIAISSFNRFNTFPIKEFIIIDDSGNEEFHKEIRKLYPSYTLILNKSNIGLVESIDKAYALVTTPYVFHSEDDYEYYRPGFIERSLVVLENDPKIMQVWLRDLTDTAGLSVEPKILRSGNIEYHLMGDCKDNWWHGFCFQCGLRKMSAYDRIKPFTKWSSPSEFITSRECKIGQAYYKLGYRAAILLQGYARHIGQKRSTFGLLNT